MFENIEDAIKYIESKRNKHTVDEFRNILRELGIHMKQKNMIHLAGTNGKGSTVNYLRAILNAHGYKVGTFTSPYLVCHNDRICIDQTPISDEDLLNYINKYYDAIEKNDLSMFEIDVLIMLDYFDSQDLDYRIIECGIGGLNDKTNVIDPIISAITNIGYDHFDQIGPTLYDVINEKMGVIKPNQLFITSETSGTVLARLQEQCDVMGAKMIVVPEYEVYEYPYEFYYRYMNFVLKDQAAYQVPNARLALTIASKLIDLDAAKTIKAVETAVWGGRYEKFNINNATVVIDGAHNIPGIQALVDTLKLEKREEGAIVFSGLRDKEILQMIDILKQTGYQIFATSFNDERGMNENEIKDKEILKVKDYKNAIDLALQGYGFIVITGSLHFISEVRKYLQKKSQ